MGLGGLAVAFSVCGLALVGAQTAFIAFVLSQQGSTAPGSADFIEVQRALARVWLTHLPIWIVLGAALFWQSRRLRNARRGAASAVAGLALVSVVELAAYAVHGASDFGARFAAAWARFPVALPVTPHTWVLVSFIAGTIAGSVPFLALAVLAWRIRLGDRR
jgi:hypothetical protein